VGDWLLLLAREEGGGHLGPLVTRIETRTRLAFSWKKEGRFSKRGGGGVRKGSGLQKEKKSIVGVTRIHRRKKGEHTGVRGGTKEEKQKIITKRSDLTVKGRKG